MSEFRGYPSIFGAAPKPLECDLCHDSIPMGEMCHQVFPGRAGVGEKSGQAMVVPSEDFKFEAAVVHHECFLAFLPDLEISDERFCIACGVALSEFCDTCGVGMEDDELE